MTTPARPTTADLPLLETKFYHPPWSADRVSRPRLINRIDPKGQLTLVSAPAGFGKTTLLAEWIATVPTDAIAWVALDHGDNDPAVFWTYLITALHRVHPNLGDLSLQLLQSPQPPPLPSILMRLLNELTAVNTDIVLILDDYHVISASAIHEGMGFLLSHRPPHLHVILASRSDPPFSLARLRSHGTLTELRVKDLRFTADEAAAFIHQVMGVQISAADVAALETRTEGWIAGLQLAALSMRGRDDLSGFIAAFSGNDRYIVDYLLEEVLQQQPDQVRQFLLQTSILERLSGALCNAVTGQTNGQTMLDTLERGNLFLIPLDNQRQWYRYHHLFADVLQAHAEMAWPADLPRLHGNASEWYEQHALFAEAIQHALAAQDFERAAGLIERVWPTMRKRQQETTVLRWLKRLPNALIRERPLLSLIYALVLLNAGQLEAVEARLQDAERQMEEQAAQYPSLPASIANARAYRAQALGDFACTITYAQQALALLPTDDGYERGTTAAILGLAYWSSGDVAAAHRSFAEGLRAFETLGGIQITIAATFILANMQMAQGLLRTAAQTCAQALHLAAQQPGPMLLGTPELHLALSEIHYEQGDLAAARQQLQQGEALRQQVSISGADYLWALVNAELMAASGDVDSALAQLQIAEELYRPSPVPNVRPMAALKVRWWLQQEKLAAALAWVEERGVAVDDAPSYLQEYEHLTLARVAIAQYKHNGVDEVIQPAIGLLNRLLAAAKAQDRQGSLINILVVLALAREAEGEDELAMTALEQALTLAAPEGQVRLFAECGPPLAPLLQECITRHITPTFTTQVLTASATWGKPPPLPTSPITPFPTSPIEPLTHRELAVLRLLNTELSGPEIARELVVALSTVRTHTKRIYSKLNVTNRRAAVKRAVELGLI